MLFLLYMNYVYISKDLGRNWQEPRTDIFRAIRIIFYLGYYLSMLWWPSFCGPSWTICRLETYQLHLVVLFIYCSSQGPIGNSFGIVAFFKDWVGSFQTELLEPMPFSSWIKLSILAPPEGSAKWAPRQPGLTWPFAFVYGVWGTCWWTSRWLSVLQCWEAVIVSRERPISSFLDLFNTWIGTGVQVVGGWWGDGRGKFAVIPSSLFISSSFLWCLLASSFNGALDLTISWRSSSP